MVPISNWTRTSRRRQWRWLFCCWRLPCKTVRGLLRSKKQHFKVLRAQWAIPNEKDVVEAVTIGVLTNICAVDRVGGFLQSERFSILV